jgi:hypothetical protein
VQDSAKKWHYLCKQIRAFLGQTAALEFVFVVK